MIAVMHLGGRRSRATLDEPRLGAEVVVDHVSKSYAGRVQALRDVSFRLAAGDIALLTGRSGSGKTTLLNLIAGLTQPDSGSIVVAGTRLDTVADTARYRRDVVGIVFQLHHLLATLSAQENVEIPLIPLGLPAAERRGRAAEALAAVGLGARSRHRPAELSGGERQRVAVARALVNRPSLLLADEPTGSLDETTANEILELICEVSRTRRMTVLLVSYDPVAADHAQRIMELREGRLSEHSAAGEPSPAPS